MPSSTVERPARRAESFEGMERRDTTAERIHALLTHEPQSGAELGRRIGLAGPANAAMNYLNSRGLAKRVKVDKPGHPLHNRIGWVRGDAPAPAVEPEASEEFTQPFATAVLPLSMMFVDDAYQRPLTTFVERIARHFNPALVGTLVVSEREDGSHAIIDGQTRWDAMRRRGIKEWACLVFTGLSRGDEATIFARLQSERRGVTSWDRFRAVLAGNPDDPATKEAKAIQELARTTGYTLGHDSDKLRAIVAVESCYRKDAFLLERTLVTLRTAFQGATEIPNAQIIRGLHYWMRDPRHEFRKKGQQWDDEKLVRRLRTAGLAGLSRKASMAAEVGGSSSSERNMALAIDGAYRQASGTRRAA